MGSSNPQSALESTIALSTTYANSDTIESQSNDYITLEFDISTAALVSEVTIKVQTMPNGIDVYKQGSTDFEVDAMVVPLSASTANQTFALRFDTKGLRDFRLAIKTDAGTATVNTIKAIRDGSSTPTPAS